MNRRNFLGNLFKTTAVALIAPSIINDIFNANKFIINVATKNISFINPQEPQEPIELLKLYNYLKNEWKPKGNFEGFPFPFPIKNTDTISLVNSSSSRLNFMEFYKYLRNEWFVILK